MSVQSSLRMNAQWWGCGAPCHPGACMHHLKVLISETLKPADGQRKLHRHNLPGAGRSFCTTVPFTALPPSPPALKNAFLSSASHRCPSPSLPVHKDCGSWNSGRTPFGLCALSTQHSVPTATLSWPCAQCPAVWG